MCGEPPSLIAIQCSFGHRANLWPNGFREHYHRFTRAGLRNAYHCLTGSNDLPRLTQRFNNRSVHVRCENSIGGGILCHLRLGLCCRKLRPRSIRSGLCLLIALARNPSLFEQLRIAFRICFRLTNRCARRGNSIALRRQRKTEIGFVNPHQRLAGLDLLPRIDKAFYDLAGDAKTKIALHPRRDHARKTALGTIHRHRYRELHDRWIKPRIARRESIASNHPNDDHKQQQGRDQCAPYQNGFLLHCYCFTTYQVASTLLRLYRLWFQSE